MATKDAPAPNPNDVSEAEAAAEKDLVKARDKGGDITKAKEKKAAVGEKETNEAVKNALDSDGRVRTDDEGRVIGLDGENPVSNENPHPLMVRYNYTLG